MSDEIVVAKPRRAMKHSFVAPIARRANGPRPLEEVVADQAATIAQLEARLEKAWRLVEEAETFLRALGAGQVVRSLADVRAVARAAVERMIRLSDIERPLTARESTLALEREFAIRTLAEYLRISSHAARAIMKLGRQSDRKPDALLLYPLPTPPVVTVDRSDVAPDEWVDIDGRRLSRAVARCDDLAGKLAVRNAKTTAAVGLLAAALGLDPEQVWRLVDRQALAEEMNSPKPREWVVDELERAIALHNASREAA